MKKTFLSSLRNSASVKRSVQVALVFLGALILQARAHASDLSATGRPTSKLPEAIAMTPEQEATAERVFPKCFDSFGLKVKYFSFKDDRHGVAFATKHNGIPATFYNMQKLEMLATSLDTAKFILHHECAHHKLGHLRAGSQDDGTKTLELQADCEAAKQARIEGLNLNKITHDLMTFTAGSSHPQGFQRVHIVKKCYGEQGL